MIKRIDFDQILPEACMALTHLDNFVASASLEPELAELIRIRSSQLNGCAYCLDMHIADGLKTGISPQKIHLIAAWKEAGEIFSHREQLVLMLTEQVSLINVHGFSDFLYEEAIQEFGNKKFIEIIMTILAINAWNRIGIISELKPSSRHEQ